MTSDLENWEHFLPAFPIQTCPSSFAHDYAGETVCVAGAAGYIGSSLSETLAAGGIGQLVLLDSSEYGLFTLERRLRTEFPNLSCHAVLGSIDDAPLLDELFSHSRPSVVFHAAAFKHVGLLEHNPLAAIANNTLGSYALTSAAVRHRIPKLLLVSTDKAVSPHSVMGVSKRLAEMLTLSLSNPAFASNAIRLVNVIGSPGSVVPIFEDRIRQRLPLPVTDAEASRYFLPKHVAVEAILAAGVAPCRGRVLLPEVGRPVRIADLASFLTTAHENGASAPPKILFTGLRAGEKLTEDLIRETEACVGNVRGSLTILETPILSLAECERIVAQLSACCNTRDYSVLLDTLRVLVPEYVPSEVILTAARSSCQVTVEA